jgi:hypothetical protein
LKHAFYFYVKNVHEKESLSMSVEAEHVHGVPCRRRDVRVLLLPPIPLLTLVQVRYIVFIIT